MKPVFSASILLSLLPITAVATEPASMVCIDERVEAAGADGVFHETGTNHNCLSGQRLRIESGSRVTLYDGEARVVNSLSTAKKFVVTMRHDPLVEQNVLPPTALIGVALDRETGGGRVPEKAFRSTGRTEEIEGRKAAIVETSEPDFLGETVTLDIAKLAVSWSDIQAPVRRVFTDKGSKYDAWFEQIAKLDGYPVRTERRGKDHAVRTTVVKVETRPFDATLFSVPAGFHPIEAP